MDKYRDMCPRITYPPLILLFTWCYELCTIYYELVSERFPLALWSINKMLKIERQISHLGFMIQDKQLDIIVLPKTTTIKTRFFFFNLKYIRLKIYPEITSLVIQSLTSRKSKKLDPARAVSWPNHWPECKKLIECPSLTTLRAFRMLPERTKTFTSSCSIFS